MKTLIYLFSAVISTLSCSNECLEWNETINDTIVEWSLEQQEILSIKDYNDLCIDIPHSLLFEINTYKVLNFYNDSIIEPKLYYLEGYINIGDTVLLNDTSAIIINGNIIKEIDSYIMTTTKRGIIIIDTTKHN